MPVKELSEGLRVLGEGGGDRRGGGEQARLTLRIGEATSRLPGPSILRFSSEPTLKDQQR